MKFIELAPELAADWDESLHPRGQPENAGEFASGPGGSTAKEPPAAPTQGVEFVSPNIREGTKLKQARIGLKGTRHKFIVHAAEEVDKALGLHPEVRPVIGMWADGAENSTMSVMQNPPWDTLVQSAAMKGWLAQQKQVLIFKEGETDPSHGDEAALGSIDVMGKPAEISQYLAEHGLPYHTIEPMYGNDVDNENEFRVHVFIGDKETGKALAEAGNHYGSKATVRGGRGAFLGTHQEGGSDADQRADARRVFDGLLAKSGNAGIAAVWKGLRDRLGPAADKVISDQTETPQFKHWFGDSKIVDADGQPQVMYHGTLGNFDSFDKSMGSVEGNWGAGLYFTNDRDDMSHNYAGRGPDITNRIDTEADRLQDEDEFEGSYEDAQREAEKRLHIENEGNAIPVFLKMEQPFKVGGKDETFLDYDMPYNEETEEYGEPGGKAQELIDAIKEIGHSGDYFDTDGIDALATDLQEHAIDNDGIQASKLEQIASKAKNFSYVSDENGKLVPSEILRRALEKIGYDGIIDTRVSQKFPRMRGMKPTTAHYIVFDPHQVKSAIGNKGAFDPKSTVITDSMFRADAYNPNQPRVPKGQPGAGQWASEASGGVGMGFTEDPKASNDAFAVWRHKAGILKVQHATGAWKWAGANGQSASGEDEDSLNKWITDHSMNLQGKAGLLDPPPEDLLSAHGFTYDKENNEWLANGWKVYFDTDKKWVAEKIGSTDLHIGEGVTGDKGLSKFLDENKEKFAEPANAQATALMAKMGFKADKDTGTKSYTYYDHPSLGQLVTHANGVWEWTPADGKEVSGDKSDFLKFLKDHEDELTPKSGPVIDALKAMGFTGQKVTGGWANYTAPDGTLIHVKEMTGEYKWKPPGSSEVVGSGEGERELLTDLRRDGKFHEKANELLKALPEPEGEKPMAWAPHPEAMDVGGEEGDWNHDTAVRLENEFVAAAPELDAIAAAAWHHPEPKGSGLAGTGEDLEEEAEEEEDEDEDEDSTTPESWDELTEDQKDEAFNKWKNNNDQDFINSEIESWQESGQPLQQAKTDLADEGTDAEYVQDAIDELFDDYEDKGKPIPYTKAQIKAAIDVSGYKSKYDDGKSDPDFTIDPDAAGNPEGLAYDPEKQGVLPGFEAPKPSEAFTDDMQSDLSDLLTSKFNDAAESTAGDMDAPDYITDSAHEYMDQYWEEKDDDDKFKIASDYLDFDEDKPSKKPKVLAKPQYGEVTALDHPPKKYDPLNYTSGSNYQRTQAISHAVAIQRGLDVLKKRGLIAPEVSKAPTPLDQVDAFTKDLTQMKEGKVSGEGSDWKGVQARMAVASTGLKPQGDALQGWPGITGEIGNIVNKEHPNFDEVANKAPGYVNLTPDQQNALKTQFIAKVVAATTLRATDHYIEGKPNKEYAKTIMEPYEMDAFRPVGDIFSDWVAKAANKLREDQQAKTSVNVKGAVKRIDDRIWKDWVGSSTSLGGKLIQIAAADELGGRLRLPSRPKLNEVEVQPVTPESVVSRVMPEFAKLGVNPTTDMPGATIIGKPALAAYSGILNTLSGAKLGDSAQKVKLAKIIAGVTKVSVNKDGDVDVEVGKIPALPDDAVVPGSEEKGPFLQHVYQTILDGARENIEKNIRTRISNVSRQETDDLRTKATRDAKAQYGGYVAKPPTPENVLATARTNDAQRDMTAILGHWFDHDDGYKALGGKPSPYGVATYLSANTKFQVVDGKLHAKLDMGQLLLDMPEARKWVEDHKAQIENRSEQAAFDAFGKAETQRYDEAVGKYDTDARGAWETKEELMKQADDSFPEVGGYAGIKALMRAKWETTQWLLAKAGIHSLDLFRGISDDRVNLPTTEKVNDQGHVRLPQYTMLRNGAASTSLNSKVSNGWGPDNERVVLRLKVPRTAAISLPSYGQNEHKEREVVVTGTAWKDWDAWKKTAPEFDDIPITRHKEAPSTRPMTAEPMKEAA